MHFRFLGVGICLLFTHAAFAVEVNLPGMQISVLPVGAAVEDVSQVLQIVALLTVLSLAPAILIVMTSFTRIVIVLAMLRHALGLPSVPPNAVLMSLALFLTLFTMLPVIEKIESQSLTPYLAEQKSFSVAGLESLGVLKDFMLRQTRESDLEAVLDMSGRALPEDVESLSLSSLVPAFLLSELKTAFQIGFIIFIPFLLVDVIVASLLMALGMIMVPPLTISLPIKILLFVLIDGWVVVMKSLVGSFTPL